MLHYRKFRFESAIVDVFLENVEDLAEWVAPVRSIRRRTLTPRDPDDAIFLECVTAGDADYLITGNKADNDANDWYAWERAADSGCVERSGDA